MNLEEKLAAIMKAWEESKARSDAELEKKLKVIYNFVLSFSEPTKFTDVEKEDLRRLAKELNYTEDTNFDDWLSKQLTNNSAYGG